MPLDHKSNLQQRICRHMRQLSSLGFNELLLQTVGADFNCVSAAVKCECCRWDMFQYRAKTTINVRELYALSSCSEHHQHEHENRPRCVCHWGLSQAVRNPRPVNLHPSSCTICNSTASSTAVAHTVLLRWSHKWKSSRCCVFLKHPVYTS